MRYGFYLPTRGPSATPVALEALVSHAEVAGFHSVVIADHIVLPVTMESKYPYTVSGIFPSDGDSLEQLSLLAFIAGKTRRLRLIASVMIVPHRNPVITAKSLATIDLLSEGRVTVGVGVGWLREEFEALRAPDFDERGAVTDEYLQLFKALWTEAPTSFAGKFYDLKDVWCLPQPVQKPHPPIWIGGHSRAALRRAARFGDGWHPVGANPASPLRPDEMAAKIAELHRFIEAEGRDPASVSISYKAPLYDTSVTGSLDESSGERRPFSGNADQILSDISTYEALGVRDLILDFRAETLAESLDRMDRFVSLTGLAPA